MSVSRAEEILVKTESELDRMRRAGQALAGILEQLRLAVEPGIVTYSLDQLALRLIQEAGAIPGFKGYRGFPQHVCISVNEEVVHGIPGTREIREGDLVGLDLGIILDGYWADAGLTVPVGRVSAEAQRLADVTREALERAIERAVPGGLLSDISRAVQETVEAAGFSVVREYVGHGVGRKMHEPPEVPNWYDPRRPEVPLVAGMTLAIEPMVNQKGWKTRTQPDGWTVVTADGGLSAYWEHTVAITASGPEVLTRLGAVA
ncbi:MAG: type I methionyl aminopeptidase [Candidatus Dormibacteria bacterium]